MSKQEQVLKKLKTGHRLSEQSMRGGADATGEMLPPDSVAQGWQPRSITTYPGCKPIGQQASAPPTAAPRQATPTPKPSAGRQVKLGVPVTVGGKQYCATVPNAMQVGSFVCPKCRKPSKQVAGAVQWATFSPTYGSSSLCVPCAKSLGLTATK